MNERLVVAPDYIDPGYPLIFLAGPIQQTWDWQSKAVKIILSSDPKVWVANPRRPIKISGDLPPKDYEIQVDWETNYLRKAAATGSILFWLAKETEHRCDRAYAQTTRAELFEWKVKHQIDRTSLVIGIEEGFSGAKYIRHRLEQDCPMVTILDSLEETCQRAINLSYKVFFSLKSAKIKTILWHSLLHRIK